VAATKCNMIFPSLQLFQIDLNCQDCSSLEDHYNIYSIFKKQLNYNILKRKENLNSEIETTPVNKKLKYEPDITDTELVQCEIKTSALRKKKYQLYISRLDLKKIKTSSILECLFFLINIFS